MIYYKAGFDLQVFGMPILPPVLKVLSNTDLGIIAPIKMFVKSFFKIAYIFRWHDSSVERLQRSEHQCCVQDDEKSTKSTANKLSQTGSKASTVLQTTRRG